MPSNQGFAMNIKANNGNYVPLMPKVLRNYVQDWNLSDLNGPYTVQLPASGWSGLQQTVSMQGITSNDIPFCVKVLTGSVEEMTNQDRAYSLLDSKAGIESLDGQLRFTCVGSAPTVDLTVQIYWTT